MTELLLLLGKLNLAMGAAIVVVCLLRRPLRAQFGAPVAYALWLLVPIAALASLLPPRMALPAPAAPLHVILAPIAAAPVFPATANPSRHITDAMTGLSAPTQSILAPAIDYATLLFAAWALGTMVMALYLVRLQLRFHAAARLGEAGPAVAGFLRPHVVMPDSFEDQFTAAEQAAILAHEHTHLARQDARINAATALLRCLCWFNPLIHLGDALMRMDQELACDSAALRGPVSRHAYASALLKSQITATALPLGCNWPGSEHPLIERVALLSRKPPGAARRVAGASLVLIAATIAGLGAWAAQPPVPAKYVPAKAVAAPPARIALATRPATAPAADAKIDSSSHDGDVSANVPTDTATAPANAQTPVNSFERTASSLAPSSTNKVAADPLTYPAIRPASPALENAVAFNTMADAANTASATASGSQPVVMASTPNGTGDPDTIVCRAAQRMPGSDQLGPEACGHNSEWWQLMANGKDLAPDGKTLITRPTVAHPTGDGDPEAVTCRTPQFIPYGPLVEICRPNRFWADLIKNRQFVNAHGKLVTMRRTDSSDIGAGWNNSSGTDSGFVNSPGSGATPVR